MSPKEQCLIEASKGIMGAKPLKEDVLLESKLGTDPCPTIEPLASARSKEMRSRGDSAESVNA